MAYQWDWAGNTMINKGIIVDVSELDKPQEQLRNLVLPPDPRPVLNARIEPYAIDEAGPASTNLVVAASAGNTTLFVQSVSGFTVGHEIYVYLDNGGFVLTTIQSLDSVANSMAILPQMPSSAAVQKIVCATGANDVT